jgi:malate dehydrogenase
MAIASTGDYGVPDGLVSGFPVTTEAGQFRVVAGLDIDDFSRERIDATVAELIEERDTVHTLGLLGG